ncbi:MAG: acyl-CoA dehydrogenase [Sneathiella sp.]|jgi:isovaleryl-CoA dehydrogenase|uniref:acyl-CoA dehydrogenase family protein n=1 Tax=Sneathiella sp. TaxID=1964365 RepID=UPI000C589A7C|nr:acyl-CoA dehydrogenase family protein [Sneathiella sp.]MAL77806.1 acyl-CoA dehydrogenase [Sneathiella sp.]
MRTGIGEYRSGKQFGLTEEQIEICAHASELFKEKLYPLQQKMDDEDWWPEEAFREIAGMGYLGTTIPPEYGGQGLDYLTAGLICETMAYWNPTFAFSWLNSDNLVIDNIYRNGTEEQRERFLPAMCRGEMIGALGMTEPGAGSDALGSMKTNAVKEGDSYIVNGSKIYITNGPIADVVLTYVRTSRDMGRSKGISALLVETDQPGFRVGRKLDKMGFRGSPTGELFYDDCHVPTANLVGEENQGHIIMHSGLDLERVMSAMLCIGPARRALDLAIDHANLREQFGRPIASFQMIQSKIAEMYIALETARTFVYRVLDVCSKAQEEEYGRGHIHMLASAALFQAAKAGTFIMDEAVQIHGGSGYMRDTEINRLYRTTKVMEIGAGSQEIRRIIVASGLLKGH